MRCFSLFLHMYWGLSFSYGLLLPFAGKVAAGAGLYCGLHLHGFALEHNLFPFTLSSKALKSLDSPFHKTRGSIAVCASSSHHMYPAISLLLQKSLLPVVLCA